MISLRIFIVLVVILWGTISTQGQSVRLKVVIGLENIERFYTDVRKYEKEQLYLHRFMSTLLYQKRYGAPPRTPATDDLSADVKKLICAHIFRSGTFRKMGLARPQLPSPNVFTNIIGGFMYGWQTFTVHTPFKQFQEVAFPCSITDLVTKQRRTFYISREYDVNVDFESMSIGRFVLTEDENQMLSVIDVAEEAADLIEDSLAKLTPLYVESRVEGTDIARNVKENNLCQLDANQRHQVCSSIMNAQYFEDILEYYMSEESEKKSCKDISEDSWILEANEFRGEDSPLEESLIVCAVKLLGAENTFYLVARGNEADNVFVFAHESGHRIRLLNLSKHVRNVYEWRLPVTTGQKETGTISGSKVASE